MAMSLDPRTMNITYLGALGATLIVSGVVMKNSAEHAGKDSQLGVVFFALVADHEFGYARYAHLDPDMIDLALVVMAVRRLDHHPAGGEMVKILLQLFSLFAHARFNRR